MAYTWTNGEVITAEKLNQTGGSGGGGIFKVTVSGEFPSSFTTDKSSDEILEAWQSGLLPVVELSTIPGTVLMPIQINTESCDFDVIIPGINNNTGLILISINGENVGVDTYSIAATPA